MRTTTKMKTIKVTEKVHERLTKDRDEFEKLIGGGKWSIDDTLKEYFKILKTLEKRKC